MDKARLAAFNAVKRVLGGAYSNLINSFDGLTGIDRAFAESIALGAIERRITLEFVINSALRESTKQEVIYLLMTGLYQILYMDKVPDSAACDQTVFIAKKIFGASCGGFVNAVLRGICRNKEEIYSKIEQADGYIRYSVNEELYTLIKSQYPDDAERIFEAFFGKPSFAVRVNTLKCDSDSVAKKVDGVAVGVKTVICENPRKAIELIASGEYFVQGLASQKAVLLLDAQPGQTVIDVCACPGGKTLGAAIDMNNEGRIYAFDLHKNKLPLIQKNAQSLGVSIIETEVHDSRKLREELIGIADRVICDVPCSGTGVMGSKPEIKYKSPTEFEGLYPTQRAILDSGTKYLKLGGILVYSTCSINKKENEENIRRFLNENDGFKLLHEETCLPFNEEKEGFYIAKILREY